MIDPIITPEDLRSNFIPKLYMRVLLEGYVLVIGIAYCYHIVESYRLSWAHKFCS